MTYQEIMALGGTYPLRSGRHIYSEEAFKKKFKVGDYIQMGVGVVRRISAIGHHSFLCTETVNAGERYESVREYKRQIRDPKGYARVNDWKKTKN